MKHVSTHPETGRRSAAAVMCAAVVIALLATGCQGYGDPLAAEKYFELCDKRNYRMDEMPAQCEIGADR